MKAFFNRLSKQHKDSPPRPKDSASESEKDREKDTKHSSTLPHDRFHEPLPLPPTPPALPTFEKPLPDIDPLSLPSITIPPTKSSAPSSGISSSSKPSTKPSKAELRDSQGNSTTRSRQTASTVPSHGDAVAPKKVAFISPPPTPAGAVVRNLPADSGRQSASESTSSKPHLPLSKAAPGPVGSRVTSMARDRQSTGGSTLVSTGAGEPSKPANTSRGTRSATPRAVTSPAHSQRAFAINNSSTALQRGDGVSVRSGTPFSQYSARSGVQAAASWSEAAEEDLVSNLGPRERTRQEVLYEIVASEDRYVTELLKLKETFIDPLLHPYSTATPINSPTFYDSAAEDYGNYRSDSPLEDSLDHLPIAARFLSPTPRPETPSANGHSSNTRNATTSTTDTTPIIPSMDKASDSEEDDQLGQAFDSRKVGAGRGRFSTSTQNRSPYGQKPNRQSVPFPSRSHQSLPPPPRPKPHTSTASLGRQSMILPEGIADRKNAGTPASRVFKKLQKKSAAEKEREREREESEALAPHLLPEDLRICLQVIETGILDGHVKLADGLRKRYMEQYPLVRSLADVFVANSHILHEYATYVLHLEKALEQVENALSTVSLTKKPKQQDLADWQKVCKVLQNLELLASYKGETGLAISLSKPFQRLLKYPLLFQNLLFHTDPSTFEYESTLQMVAEVETIVRSIEDEKIQKEERDRTRDVFARIDGLEKVKLLAVPKPSRLLVDERLLVGESEPSSSGVLPKSVSMSPTLTASSSVKTKSSFKRFSDVLQPGSGSSGKKDVWLVVFNDVVLRCQRTGVTTLPLAAPASTGNPRANSMPELNAKGKFATNGKRTVQVKPRNLYKFVKIETWAIGDVAKPQAGIVSMADIERSRAEIASGTKAEDDLEEEVDSDDSDRKSKMSFSYWGADKITVQPVTPKAKAVPRGTGARKSAAPSSYVRESSANAKFGTRLRSPEPSADGSVTRPSSRRQAASQQSNPRAGTALSQSEDSHAPSTNTKVSSSRPAWDSNPRSMTPMTPTPTAAQKRVQTLSATSSQAPRLNKLSSPAPSEDSGVGFYRQMIAQDPSLS